jgi:hypothetical protein
LLKITQVPIADADREVLARRRPGLLRRRARHLWDVEVEDGVCLEYEFDVRRVWDLSECSPGCCPNSYLIECGDGEFVVVESWEESLDKQEDHLPGGSVRLRVLPRTGMVLSASFRGASGAIRRTLVTRRACRVVGA